jgi:hypothetical protein
VYKKLKNPIPVIIDADIGRTAISITIGFFLFVLLAVFLFLSAFVHASDDKIGDEYHVWIPKLGFRSFFINADCIEKYRC